MGNSNSKEQVSQDSDENETGESLTSGWTCLIRRYLITDLRLCLFFLGRTAGPPLIFEYRFDPNDDVATIREARDFIMGESYRVLLVTLVTVGKTAV
jgi:hypothetical protein